MTSFKTEVKKVSGEKVSQDSQCLANKKLLYGNMKTSELLVSMKCDSKEELGRLFYSVKNSKAMTSKEIAKTIVTGLFFAGAMAAMKGKPGAQDEAQRVVTTTELFLERIGGANWAEKPLFQDAKAALIGALYSLETKSGTLNSEGLAAKDLIHHEIGRLAGYFVASGSDVRIFLKHLKEFSKSLGSNN